MPQKITPLGIRLAAQVLDFLLLVPIISISVHLFLGGPEQWIRWMPHQWQFWLIPFIQSAYTLGCWIFYQGTPGKQWMGCQIVDTRTSLPPSVIQCIIRFLVYPISFLVFGLGFAWAFLRQDKRTWHDLAAGTSVVYP